MGVRNGPANVDAGDLAELKDLNDVGVVPVLFRIDIADAASGNTNVTMQQKVRVYDALVVKTGGNGAASNTYRVGNAANNISDAMDGNINDTLNVRAAEINDANHEIDAGGSLRVTWVKSGGNVAATVYIMAVVVSDA